MNGFITTRRISRAAPVWVAAGLLLAAGFCRAGDAPEKRHRMENRFLIIIDNSSGMRDRAKGVERAVAGLIESGMSGELRTRDTIGIWTYGDALNTDFPMLVWSDKKKDALLDQVHDFIRDLQYHKRSHLEKVLPKVWQVMTNSERLTVIFVYDGSEPMKGTPFDKDINALQKKYAHDFREANVPFVTIVASRDGTAFDYTINYPGSMIVPHTADPLPPPPDTNTPPPVVVQPPPPGEPKTNHHIEIIMSGTNVLAHEGDVVPPATNAVAVVATPPPPTTPPPAPAPIPTPALIAQVVTNTPPAAPGPTTTQPAPAPAPPVAVQVAAETNTPVVSATPTAPPPATRPAASAPKVAPIAAAVPATPQYVMVIMAVSLLTIAVVLVIFLVRRSRNDGQSSLISQAIDRSR